MHLGPVVLPNEPAADWPSVYAQRRLLPLLVHAILFGGGYGASAERAARRYG
jgi:hypothetical protein